MNLGFKVFGVITCGLGTVFAFANPIEAATLKISITNHQPAEGLYLTPLFFTLHDGSLDFFDESAVASTAVEDLAEGGDPSGLISAAGSFTNGVITSPGGFAGAPVIDPGETATVRVSVDPASGMFFSFLSMVIPSNDNFIGNDSPTAYQVFDAAGNFSGIGPISVLGSDVWDAGTEENSDTGVGAAFSTAGGVGTDENGVVTRQASLDFLIGIPTPAGFSVNSAPGASDIFATIEISQVPIPAGMPLLLGGLGILAVARKRRR